MCIRDSLTAELVVCVGLLGVSVRRDVREEAYQQEAAVNRYLGYDAPDGFTDTAVEAMTGLTPVDGESYYESVSYTHLVEENDVILMHDSYRTTVEAALRIVDELQKKGYEFVTADELILE